MKLNLIFSALGGLLFAQNGQVGINTPQPNSSAVLEISADPPPNSTITTKKGLLLPKVSLLSNGHVATVPAPAKGLMVYNLTDAGAFPNEVKANTYYYWNGTKWMAIALYSFVEEAVKPRIFYVESSQTTTFTPSQLNFSSGGTAPKNVVTFSETPVINVANIITVDNVNSTFKAKFYRIIRSFCVCKLQSNEQYRKQTGFFEFYHSKIYKQRKHLDGHNRNQNCVGSGRSQLFENGKYFITSVTTQQK